MARIHCSLIQSNFGGDHGNFEAVILEGNSLVHWFRGNTIDNPPWRRGGVVAPGIAAAAGSIIQSDMGDSQHGNFEVVVPLWAPDQTMELWHFWHDNSDVNLPWARAQRVTTNVAAPACIIQSDFKGDGPANFELVVPIVSPEGSIDLWHFWRENSDVSTPWQRGGMVAAGVAGPGSLIRSNFGSGGHGNFEVVVPRSASDGSTELWHFWHDNSDVNSPWQRGGLVAANVNGPGELIQSDFGSSDHGNFEVVVPIGNSLVHFWHDNSDVNSPWQRGQDITDACNGWASLMRSNYGPADHKNFELLVEECTQSLAAYWHPNQDTNLPWMRDQVLLFEPYPAQVVAQVGKIAQLTGEYDRQGWDGTGTPPLAFNRTQTLYGIHSCDLGSSFEHRNRVYFLFGDTIRDGWPMNLDTIAFCTDTDASAGLHLTFYKQPPLFPAIDQSAFSVPLDGVSLNDTMYVFFSTDHYNVDGRDLMGRCVLGRSDNDGYDYSWVGEISRWKFINVSVAKGVADANLAPQLGLNVGAPVLWMFGSGRYRASSVCLALMPLDSIGSAGPLFFFTGTSWSRSEADAAPLFCSADVGELCGRWNPFLQRWLITYNSANPRGILLRSATQPWGPWSSQPVMLFDPTRLSDPNNPCSGAGYGKFMHVPWNVRQCDHVQDDMFGSWRDNEWGAEYGPYQIASYATGTQNQESVIYFTMSSWNPYQSNLMMATILQQFVS